VSTHQGTIQQVRFRSSDSDFAVITFAPVDGYAFTAVGQVPRCARSQLLEITGDWDVSPRYGRQFKIDAAVRARPSTTPAIAQFLVRNVKGCRPKLAERLLARTGLQLEDFLKHRQEELLAIKGMKPDLLTKIGQAWNANALDKQVSLFLADNGVSLSWTRKIMAHFGSHTVEILRANPYKFIEIEGISFKKADDIALRMGWGARLCGAG
jgi:exodeoxyribonuclease V alpha subunit